MKIPAGVSDEQAAVLMLKGMTACYLLRHTYRVKRGDVIVVHAAAGGVGLLLSQWGRALGATVIGIVGSDEKAKLAKKNGCKHVLVRGRDRRRRRDGEEADQGRRRARGVRRASARTPSSNRSIACAGADCMVSYGNASGPVAPFSPAELVKRGSLYVTRPTLFDYTATRAELEAVARETFAAVKKKWIKIQINQRYKLADAAQAHRDLEGRKTTGASVILPA